MQRFPCTGADYITQALGAKCTIWCKMSRLNDVSADGDIMHNFPAARTPATLANVHFDCYLEAHDIDRP